MYQICCLIVSGQCYIQNFKNVCCAETSLLAKALTFSMIIENKKSSAFGRRESSTGEQGVLACEDEFKKSLLLEETVDDDCIIEEVSFFLWLKSEGWEELNEFSVLLIEN